MVTGSGSVVMGSAVMVVCGDGRGYVVTGGVCGDGRWSVVTERGSVVTERVSVVTERGGLW